MKEIIEIKTKVPVPADKLREVFDKYSKLGFVERPSNHNLSITYHMLENKPFDIEIICLCKDPEDENENGIWYAKIETNKELQEITGTQEWEKDKYEEGISTIFKQLGLDPSTKDNRNMTEILGIVE